VLSPVLTLVLTLVLTPALSFYQVTQCLTEQYATYKPTLQNKSSASDTHHFNSFKLSSYTKNTGAPEAAIAQWLQ